MAAYNNNGGAGLTGLLKAIARNRLMTGCGIAVLLCAVIMIWGEPALAAREVFPDLWPWWIWPIAAGVVMGGVGFYGTKKGWF